jgi:hypothetical protein
VNLVPYCPEQTLSLCDAVTELRGLLKRCRITGFTHEYSEMLLCCMFAAGNDGPAYTTLENCGPWPAVPPQTPWPRYDSALNSLSLAPMSPQFKLPYTPSFLNESFPEEVKEDMRMYESSVYSDVSTAHPDDTHATVDFQNLTVDIVPSLADHLQKYQDCVGSLDGSEIANCGSPEDFQTDHQSKPRITFSDPPIAEATHFQSQKGVCISTPTRSEIDESSQDSTPTIRNRLRLKASTPRILECRSSPLLSTPTHCELKRKQGTLTPTIFGANEGLMISMPTSVDSTRLLMVSTPTSLHSQSHTPPKSPNTMNNLNEKDPAYIRSLPALRIATTEALSTPKKSRPKSLIASPKAKLQDTNRAQTSLGTNKGPAPIKRYLSFVKRLGRNHEGHDQC